MRSTTPVRLLRRTRRTLQLLPRHTLPRVLPPIPHRTIPLRAFTQLGRQPPNANHILTPLLFVATPNCATTHARPGGVAGEVRRVFLLLPTRRFLDRRIELRVGFHQLDGDADAVHRTMTALADAFAIRAARFPPRRFAPEVGASAISGIPYRFGVPLQGEDVEYLLVQLVITYTPTRNRISVMFPASIFVHWSSSARSKEPSLSTFL
jgi:hypothetical protein